VSTCAQCGCKMAEARTCPHCGAPRAAGATRAKPAPSTEPGAQAPVAGGLTAWAAKGAARESAQRAAKQAKARREAGARDRATLTRAKSATTWLAPIAGWKGAIAVLLVAWMSFYLGPYMQLGAGKPGMSLGAWGLVAAAISLTVGLWMASFWLRELGWKRELAWLQALPFPVESYVNGVGEGLCENLVVSIRFATDAPSRQLLRQALAAVPLSLGPSVRDGEKKNSIELECEFTYKSKNGTNRYGQRKVLTWFHDLVEKVLLPVHAEKPIRSVKLSWE
jgi:hypothetical protein